MQLGVKDLTFRVEVQTHLHRYLSKFDQIWSNSTKWYRFRPQLVEI